MGVYKRSNGMWRVDVWWQGEVVWSTHRPTKGEGDEVHDEVKAALRRGEEDPWRKYEVVVHRDKATVGGWIEFWREGRKLKPKTLASQNSLIDNHIIPALGIEPLEDLTRLQIQRWVQAVSQDLMPRSVRTVYAILSEALSDAADDPSTTIKVSPAHRIRLPKAEATGRKALTPEQVAILIRYAGDRGHIIEDLALTGMRAGEYVRRERHDLTLRKTIEIAGRPTADTPGTAAAVEKPKRPVRGKRGKTKEPATKSPAGARSIILCDGHAAEWSARLAAHDLAALAVVTSRDHGRPVGPVPVTYPIVRDVIKAACAAAAEAGEDVPPGVTAQWFRVTYRTSLEDALVPEIAIYDQMGHETSGVTAAYRRVTPAMLDMIREALEERWTAMRAATPKLRVAK